MIKSIVSPSLRSVYFVKYLQGLSREKADLDGLARRGQSLAAGKIKA
jgi:hypothetical protein